MKTLWLLGSALLITSCSPAGPEIRAKMVDGAIVFETYDAGMWPFASRMPTGAVTDRFAVYSRDGAVWLIERDPGPQCRASHASIFPLKYGQLPHCFIARVAPHVLVSGTLYRVETGHDVGGVGIIRVALTVENPDWDTLDNAVYDWPGATHPSNAYPPFGTNMNADPENSVLPAGDANISSTNLVIETPPE